MKTKDEYFFNIHHRSIDVKEGITGETEQGISPGHLYLGHKRIVIRNYYSENIPQKVICSSEKLKLKMNNLSMKKLLSILKKWVRITFLISKSD